MSKQKTENQIMTSEEGNTSGVSSGSEFFDNVARLVEQARSYVGRTADLTMCVTYYEIGRMIVEEEQSGEARAKYGRGLLKELSAYLNSHVGKGYSVSTLTNARKFFQTYSPSISQSLITKSKNGGDAQKSQSLITIFNIGDSRAVRLAAISDLYLFKLSWTHYLILMRIKNEDERRFYEIEAVQQQWTVRQLQRQYGSSLYERLALSRDKDAVMRLTEEGQTIEKPRDILKNPLVLEFLGMEERVEYSESDLESAIIDKLQAFLLELGTGFLFEARQKRFTFDEEHFMVDLVFYNRLLKCYVLVDLKTGKLKHQDLGQMQMYVHYFDRDVKTEEERPTVGILLCQEKNDAVVELTLPEDQNIYASEYSLYLPNKTLLQEKLAEWTQEFEEEQVVIEAAQDRTR
ncbi:MAG: PDDEXK nuclease domain-containing protein [Actinomycetia bacterium]|nr:PDDEXK nuclease domain-containing protein [Actinomycetes bacterium]